MKTMPQLQFIQNVRKSMLTSASPVLLCFACTCFMRRVRNEFVMQPLTRGTRAPLTCTPGAVTLDLIMATIEDARDANSKNRQLRARQVPLQLCYVRNFRKARVHFTQSYSVTHSLVRILSWLNCWLNCTAVTSTESVRQPACHPLFQASVSAVNG